MNVSRSKGVFPMRKSIAIICTIFLFLTLMPTALAAGTVTLSIGDATIEAGSGTQTVQIPISISGNSGGVCGICVKMSYDSPLRLTGLKQGEALRSLVYTVPDDLTKNPVVLLWDGMEAETGDGIILYATFTVPTDKPGDYRISIDAPLGSIYDNDLEDYTVKVNKGTIHVKGEGTPSGDNGSSGENSSQGGTSSDDPTKPNDGNDNTDDENGGTKNWGKDNPSDQPSNPVMKCSYYVVLTMTDEGKTEECRVAYYPYGAATDTIAERRIDLGRISNVMVKLLEHVEESAPTGQDVICYVVTTESGRVDVEATNQLNKIGE